MSRPSILIVEDEGIIAEDLAGKIRQMGYDVAGMATTGEAAVELARRLRPALVVMDIRLAGAMDGIAAAQVIHREDNLPVLFLTAHSDMGTVERARQAEAFGYILKPFDERDLRIQIEMALYKHAAESRLRESEEQFRIMFEHSSVGMAQADPATGRYLRVNDALCRLTGHTAQELLRRSFFEATHPGDQEEVARYQALTTGTSTGYQAEKRYLRPDGTVVWGHQTVNLVVDAAGRPLCIMAVIQDITERKRAGEALQRAKEEWERTFDSVPDLITILDRRHRVVRVNKAMAGRLGRSPEECVGLSCYEAVHGTSCPPGFCPHLQTMADDRPHRVEVHEDRLEGDFLVTTTPLFDERGENTGSVHIAHDITERRRAEATQQKLNEELLAVNRELEAFSYSIAHDLRTPLRSIAGFSQIILDNYADVLDQRGQGFFQRIIAASVKMGRLIEDLLDLSLVTRAEMRRERVNLTEVARRISRSLAESDPGRSVEFRLAASLFADGDEQLFTIVLQNLLGNAWKFTQKNDHALIEFGVLTDGGERVYFVRDNGAGLDMALAGKLFDPFQRVHKAEDFPGSGIGLATVKRVVERHGGRIWLEGWVDKGATVYFTLA